MPDNVAALVIKTRYICIFSFGCLNYLHVHLFGAATTHVHNAMLTHIGVNNVIYDHASNRCEYKDLHILSECNIYSTGLSVYRNIIFVSFLSEK